MKKTLFVILCTVFLVGCGGSGPIEIGDRNFGPQVFDMLTHPVRYDGREIAMVAIYSSTVGVPHAAFRLAETCCPGDFKPLGFELIWDGDAPADYTWVRVIGVYRANRTVVVSAIETGVAPQNEVVRLF